ncbi:hypothetical protein PENSTE_c010G03232 [Penicillium steckii]|uniref:Cytochrome P450 monooxygenase n=1 Tax=Penicillium steckii TaxID=303698 RepID=A0A1V6T7G1_9EURO|nr:hypothetical protein PENSTE_c010G03232 [Penicillium steckii]
MFEDVRPWLLEQVHETYLFSFCTILNIFFAYRVFKFARHRWAYREFYRLPCIRSFHNTDLRSAMEEGTAKYTDRPFVLPLLDPTVILPSNVIDEVKSLPETRVSIDANNKRRFFGQYTLMGTKSPELLSAIKQDLHRNVGSLLTEMMEETQVTTDSLISLDHESPVKSLVVYESMLRYITLVTGRAIVGLPLSRNEEWVSSAINYAVESMKAGHQLRTYPVALRPWVAPFLSAVRRLKDYQSRIMEMLHDSVLQQRLRPENTSKLDETQGRLASWLIQHYRSTFSKEISEWNVCKDHILALFAGIHIATNAVTQVLLDLAARPEYQEPLLEEIKSVSSGTEDNTLTLAMIAKMSKLDSFIQESLRVSPPGGVVTLMRETTAPFRPSCGPLIPKGTLIAFSNNRFDMAKGTKAAVDNFDGFRFDRERNNKGSKHHLLTPSPDSLTWGYGMHACPGRSFAATEIKVIVIHLLTNFRLRLKGGKERPRNESFDFQIMPDMSAEIEFSSRKE